MQGLVHRVPAGLCVMCFVMETTLVTGTKASSTVQSGLSLVRCVQQCHGDEGRVVSGCVLAGFLKTTNTVGVVEASMPRGGMLSGTVSLGRSVFVLCLFMASQAATPVQARFPIDAGGVGLIMVCLGLVFCGRSMRVGARKVKSRKGRFTNQPRAGTVPDQRRRVGMQFCMKAVGES